MRIFQFPRQFLRSVGQIMLQPCAATGLIFLVGIAIGSPLQMTSASLGSLIGYAYARFFFRDEKWLADGLFEFSAAF
jgi:urea transporter